MRSAIFRSRRAAEGTQVMIVAHDVGGIGGMERQLVELIGGLLSRGVAITLLSRTSGLEDHPALTWRRVPGPSRPFSVAYPWFLLIASLMVWRERRGPLHTTGAIVLNRAEVCTVHLCQHEVSDQAIARARKTTLAYRINGWVGMQMARAGERLIYRPSRVARLVPVSRGVRRELDRFFPRMAERTTVIQNGVDTDHFHPAADRAAVRRELGLPSDRLLALFVGGEWERKGLASALRGIAAVPAWRLVVVGSGDRARYEELARSLGIADRVSWLEPTSEIARHYRAADAFLLPTRYETFSLVTYEAAASGLPLLVSRVSGVEDILEEGVNGYFVTDDPARVAECLRALETSVEERDRLGRAARRASLEFSWRRMVDAYSDLYRSASEPGARA